MIERVAYMSMHTSPLLVPGRGDAGGMNVYIDELSATMVGRGVGVDVFTRRTDPAVPAVVENDAGYRVIHIDAGPAEPLSTADQSGLVGEFAAAAVSWAEAAGVSYDLVHSHYWLSGWAGILVKRELDIPLANSFHTLGRVKDAARRADQPPESLLRIAAEHEVIALSDCVIASTPFEAEDLMLHYGADPGRLCTSPPGIDHDRFCPGDRTAARERLGLHDQPTVLFVGRIQPLKGLDVAIDAFDRVHRAVPIARMVVVGGPSGEEGAAEVGRLHAPERHGGRRFIDDPYPDLHTSRPRLVRESLAGRQHRPGEGQDPRVTLGGRVAERCPCLHVLGRQQTRRDLGRKDPRPCDGERIEARDQDGARRTRSGRALGGWLRPRPPDSGRNPARPGCS